jgi:anti-sigma regulatory factor (Ser/Thr protein kinase)
MPVPTLRHEALLYADDAEYLSILGSFVRDGLDEGRPIFVAVPRDRGELLKQELNGDAARVTFADMTKLGRNPSTIIPAVRAFMQAHRARRVRFVGEPIWPGRTTDEIAEATRHESLINLAFAGTSAHILCPYEVRRLDAPVVSDAYRTHPGLISRTGHLASRHYADPAVVCRADAWPLPVPPVGADVVERQVERLADIRALVRAQVRTAGLRDGRIDDVVLAVDELCSNTLKYSPTVGTLRIWRDGDHLVYEVHDTGRITDLLAGRHLVPPGVMHGRGLFTVNHLADLVQLRSDDHGTTIRLHIRL